MTHAWLVSPADLNGEQLHEVEAIAGCHRVIIGETGSGRTQVLLHRARHLYDACRGAPNRLRVFVASAALTDFLGPELPLLGLPSECLTTLDDWCLNCFRSYVRRDKPSWARRADANAVRQAVADWAAVHPEKRPLDFALVDDGLLLDQAAYILLRAVAGHVTVAAGRTPLPMGGVGAAGVAAALGSGTARRLLTGVRRGTPYLAEAAATFLTDPEDRAAFLRQSPTSAGGTETPLLYAAAYTRDEDDRIAEIIRTRQARGERVAVLLPTTRLVAAVSRALSERGLNHQAQRTAGPRLDFADGRPTVMTCGLAAGMTFDSVLLPRLTPAVLARVGAADLLFTGITRAARWAYLSFAGREPAALASLRPLVQKGALVRQERRDHPCAALALPAPAGAAQECWEDDLMDLF